jgi:hypothetical protein
VLVALLAAAGCNVFQGGRHRPKTALSEREFIDVYLALAQATRPEQEQRIFRQHRTSRKELQAFINAYSNDLPALSAVFDTLVARLGMQPGMEIPILPQ